MVVLLEEVLVAVVVCALSTTCFSKQDPFPGLCKVASVPVGLKRKGDSGLCRFLPGAPWFVRTALIIYPRTAALLL